MAFQWSKDSIACVATYNILEGEEFLDEFEDVDYPFDKANELKMGELLYYLHGASSDVMDGVAEMEAVEFLEYLVRAYGVKKRNKEKLGKIVARLTKIFRDKTKTLAALAEEVDASLRFPK